jgi:coenzyme F420-0:L-glutamate ligase/coenzyme F420-1:gamma-L-glutamate ligase
MTQAGQLILTNLPGIPQIKTGDNLAKVIYDCLQANNLVLVNGDILVLAQKIVSKAEGRMVNLATVTPSEQAVKIAEFVRKRPELIELILQESNEVLRMRPGTIIVEHRSGFVCANAGIDHSNVLGDWGEAGDWVLLLPVDSDRSAEQIRQELESLCVKQLGVMIIDSHGRAWRNGTVGVCIGLSGMPALVDKRGEKDLFDYTLRVTMISAADELAGGASLMMGQAAEGTPVVLARGFPYALRESSSSELVRSKQFDMFR